MVQVFAVRQVCEKYLANGKDVFWAFMDLEKAYDTIDRYGMWQMLRVYEVGGKLVKAVRSVYVDSRACFRVGNDVMSPWLFNVYMDGVVRELNVRVLGKGLELLSANGGRFEINQQLFADDTALLAGSEKLLLSLLCLGLSGRAGPLPIKGNKLLGSLGYRSNPQGALLQAEWLGAEEEVGQIWPDSVWSRGTSVAPTLYKLKIE